MTEMIIAALPQATPAAGNTKASAHAAQGSAGHEAVGGFQGHLDEAIAAQSSQDEKAGQPQKRSKAGAGESAVAAAGVAMEIMAAETACCQTQTGDELTEVGIESGIAAGLSQSARLPAAGAATTATFAAAVEAAARGTAVRPAGSAPAGGLRDAVHTAGISDAIAPTLPATAGVQGLPGATGSEANHVAASIQKDSAPAETVATPIVIATAAEQGAESEAESGLGRTNNPTATKVDVTERPATGRGKAKAKEAGQPRGSYAATVAASHDTVKVQETHPIHGSNAPANEDTAGAAAIQGTHTAIPTGQPLATGAQSSQPLTQQRDTADLVDQVVRAVPVPRSSGVQMVHVQLHPENLGRLVLRISRDGAGMIEAVIRAERPEVADALRGGLNDLLQELAGQGLQVRSLQVASASAPMPQGQTNTGQGHQGNGWTASWGSTLGGGWSEGRPGQGEAQDSEPTGTLGRIAGPAAPAGGYRAAPGVSAGRHLWSSQQGRRVDLVA